jgi:L-alanine-DL-glutamate epimerase-like enolase superfamily enzyme
VKIKAGDFVGYGEGLTDLAFIGETLESILWAIRNYIGPAVLGSNPFALTEIHYKIDAALVKNTAAKSAIDIACVDIAGRATGQPACNILGGDLRSRILEVPEILLDPLDEVVESCRQAVDRGVTCLKVKVEEGYDEHVEKLKRIREVVGNKVEIRLDANQGWRDYWTAFKIMKRLQRYDFSLMEQPLPADDLEGSAKLRRATYVPIMLDESIRDVSDVLAAIRLKACDVISLKVMKVGGLMRTRELVELCSAHGIPCHLGSSWETEVGWAANLSLIRALPGIKLWDAYSPTEIYWGANASIGTPIRGVLREGVRVIEAPEGPGLGVTIDDKAVTAHLVGEPISLKAS